MARDRSNLVRTVAACGIAAVLGWLSVTTGAAGVLRAGNPELALRFSSKDAGALAAKGHQRLQRDQSPAALKAAAALGQSALERDATNVVALRLIALSRPAKAQGAVFRQAQAISKRDLETQIWLIEDAVARNRVDQALVHYDVALRTSEAAPQLLFPILASATGDARLIPQITAMVARKPDWAVPFLYQAVASGPDSGTLMPVFRTLSAKKIVLPPDLRGNLLARVVRDYRFDLVPDAYRLAGGKPMGLGAGVQDGGFTRPGTLAPVDWMLTAEGGLTAEQIATQGTSSGHAVGIHAEAGVSGNAARQLLLLKPGSYRLSWKAGAIPDQGAGTMEWTVRCAKSELVVGSATVVSSGAGQADFAVPGDCTGQYLALVVRSGTGLGGEGDSPWVGEVAIRPAG